MPLTIIVIVDIDIRFFSRLQTWFVEQIGSLRDQRQTVTQLSSNHCYVNLIW